MKHRFIFLLALTAVVLAGAAMAPRLAGADTEGKALFEKRCAKCHDSDRAWSRAETPDFWRTTVQRMRGKMFSGISEADAAAITEYLIQNRSRK